MEAVPPGWSSPPSNRTRVGRNLGRDNQAHRIHGEESHLSFKISRAPVTRTQAPAPRESVQWSCATTGLFVAEPTGTLLLPGQKIAALKRGATPLFRRCEVHRLSNGQGEGVAYHGLSTQSAHIHLRALQ
jgi:hypothetical protein